MKAIDALLFAFADAKTRLRAVLYSAGLFVFFGIPTALLSNPILPYVRMIPATWLDYAFLLATSLLAGAYLALPENKSCPSGKGAAGGGILGFLAFACPTCNHLLLLIFGYAFLYDFVNPLRPALGLVSIIVLLHSIGMKFGGRGGKQ